MRCSRLLAHRGVSLLNRLLKYVTPALFVVVLASCAGTGPSSLPSPQSIPATRGITGAPVIRLMPKPHRIQSTVTAAMEATQLVSYHNGAVILIPKVYLVFWDWPSDPYHEESRLIGFLNDIGGSKWLGTVQQYYMQFSIVPK